MLGLSQDETKEERFHPHQHLGRLPSRPHLQLAPYLLKVCAETYIVFVSILRRLLKQLVNLPFVHTLNLFHHSTYAYAIGFQPCGPHDFSVLLLKVPPTLIIATDLGRDDILTTP